MFVNVSALQACQHYCCFKLTCYFGKLSIASVAIVSVWLFRYPFYCLLQVIPKLVAFLLLMMHCWCRCCHDTQVMLRLLNADFGGFRPSCIALYVVCCHSVILAVFFVPWIGSWYPSMYPCLYSNT
jgi:hypothetical protein